MLTPAFAVDPVELEAAELVLFDAAEDEDLPDDQDDLAIELLKSYRHPVGTRTSNEKSFSFLYSIYF